MATTIVNPGQTSDSSSSTGLVVGIVLLIIFGVLFLIYGLPYMSKGFGSYNTVGGNGGGTNINVPKDMNVNVKQTK